MPRSDAGTISSVLYFSARGGRENVIYMAPTTVRTNKSCDKELKQREEPPFGCYCPSNPRPLEECGIGARSLTPYPVKILINSEIRMRSTGSAL